MKTLNSLLITIILLFISCSNSDDTNIRNNNQNPSGTIRYNSLVFSSVTKTSNVVYGSNTTQGDVVEDLVMDIYEPSGDTANNRNLIILAHGGGFTGGDKESMSSLANFLAQSGYVVASINYRLLDIPVTPPTITQAVIEAMFDMKAAVRFFKKDADTTNTYRINPSTIFVGGYSAGAFMSLHYAYINTTNEVQEIGGSALVNFVNTNGGLEGNSGNNGYDSQIKGALNIAGALIKATHVNTGEPALYSAHGTNDLVVPYLTGESDNSGVVTEGSGLIHSVADAVGIPNLLQTIQGGDHGAFFSCSTCSAELRSFVFQNL